jgi:hypothetical protein
VLSACRHNQLFFGSANTTQEGLPLVVDWVLAKEVQSGLYELNLIESIAKVKLF